MRDERELMGSSAAELDLDGGQDYWLFFHLHNQTANTVINGQTDLIMVDE